MADGFEKVICRYTATPAQALHFLPVDYFRIYLTQPIKHVSFQYWRLIGIFSQST
jgi:hypothetical protein